MNKSGTIIFFIGVIFTSLIGIIVSLDPGFVCHLDPDNLPDKIWHYPTLCFAFWAFGVPVGVIISAIGILIHIKAERKTIIKFSVGTLGSYVFICIANGPIPHVPVLFGIGGTMIMSFYFLILWRNAHRLKDNAYRLAGYTFLIIGFWFTCGLGSRQYQPALGAGQSPIDIMIFFVLAMLFFWLSERKNS